MRRVGLISFLVATGCHGLILFGLPEGPWLYAERKQSEPSYLEVTLAEAPAAVQAIVASPPVTEAPPPVPSAVQPKTPPKEEPRPDPNVVPPPVLSAPSTQPHPPPTKPETETVVPQRSSQKPSEKSLPAEPPPSPTDESQSTKTSTTPAANLTAPPMVSAIAPAYHPVSQPYYLRRGKAAYPPEAKRLGQEGVVVLTLYINARGVLDKVEVKQSSGFSHLDEAAVTAEKKSRFRPAYIGDQPIPCKAEVPYRFKINLLD